MNRHEPPALRFSACLRLETGEIAAIPFDWLNHAVSFAVKISTTANGMEWWEVVDNRTRNVMASSDRIK